MSQYKTIETSFKTAESLIKALLDCGFTTEQIEVARNVKSPDLRLKAWGGAGFHEQACSIAIRREKTGGYEDTGFYWNGSAYQAIISTHDGNRPGHRDFGAGTLKQVQQRYAVNEAKRIAKIKGYSVQEQANPDGTVRLVCTHR